MPLAPGTRLGVYEVESALGAGGMGEVYRARDTKLGRAVAIKILRRQRFGGTKHEVHKGGGIHPFWWQGRGVLRLFYRLPAWMETVDIKTQPTFGFSRPREIRWSPMTIDESQINLKSEL